jgi:predicted RNA-binding protein Jag
MQTIILPLITEFWTGLGIVITSITVDVVWDDVSIRVETPDSAILIGMHGKNIAIFQHLLSRMIERKTAKFVHVHLEINDYIKLKDQKLMQFIDSKILLIQSKWGSIRIPSLTPYERKKAHNYIAELAIIWLWTQSEGEWIERSLILSYTGVVAPISTDKYIAPTKTELVISENGVGI